ncbi:P-loop containing nucleoside triphosphate hydrolase protein [Microthyrium microscopicum]|uniref:DNA 3'-5' helicase n=1 Tax=Microthyrium microscopicum TaxID=703497 RepID=A0A6A6UD71_9PEZI|nr:P-loop containing nucleoside triphosphate hydrolase protein [Microthyrium microscopicum]
MPSTKTKRMPKIPRGFQKKPANRRTNNGERFPNHRKSQETQYPPLPYDLDEMEPEELDERTKRMPRMKPETIQKMINVLTRGESYSEKQPGVLRSALKRFYPDIEPKEAQIRALRTLIYGGGDVLLIAKTGFGKSLILHAYGALTGKITLQIVPLNRLGEDQCNSIKNVEGCTPRLLTGDSKEKIRHLTRRMRRGDFSHILLSPELVSSPDFRKLLKDVEFQQRIGCVAIDECHLVHQWRNFRTKFTMIGELRAILPQDVVWFGCTGTLSRPAQETVLQLGGFRRLGQHQRQTTLLRTSIDRPDLSIVVRFIEKGKLTSFDNLYNVLRYAFQRVHETTALADENHHEATASQEDVQRQDVQSDNGCGASVDTASPGSDLHSAEDEDDADGERSGEEGIDVDSSSQYPKLKRKRTRKRSNRKIKVGSPSKIPKTIIFVDGIFSIRTALMYLRRSLVTLTSHLPDGHPKKYSRDPKAGAFCVDRIVEEYTSRSSKYDQNRRYTTFCKPDSEIRIMVATTCLGLGCHIPGVMLIIIWKIPIGYDMLDLWQRAGRGARGEGDHGTVEIWLPYYLHNEYAKERPVQDAPEPSTAITRQRKTATRHMLSSHRAMQRQHQSQQALSQQASSHPLSQVWTPGDVSDISENSLADVERESTEPESPVASSSWAGPSTQNTVGKQKKSKKIEFFSKPETKQRAKTPQEFHDLANADCIRVVIWKFLGEDQMPSLPARDPLLCCNRCNPALLLPEIAPRKDKLAELKPPALNSRGWFALEEITAWAQDWARRLHPPSAMSKYGVSSFTVLSRHTQWQLAHIFSSATKLSNLPSPIEWDWLKGQATLPHDWDEYDDHSIDLLKKLEALAVLVPTRFTELEQQRQERRKQKEATRGQSASQSANRQVIEIDSAEDTDEAIGQRREADQTDIEARFKATARERDEKRRRQSGLPSQAMGTSSTAPMSSSAPGLLASSLAPKPSRRRASQAMVDTTILEDSEPSSPISPLTSRTTRRSALAELPVGSTQARASGQARDTSSTPPGRKRAARSPSVASIKQVEKRARQGTVGLSHIQKTRIGRSLILTEKGRHNTAFPD